MSRTSNVYRVLQFSDEPLTCREITARCKLPVEDSKSVAATISMLVKSGEVAVLDERECRVSNRRSKTYCLAKKVPSKEEIEQEVENPKEIIKQEEIHQEITNQVVVITFENGKVRIDAFQKKAG